jgi:hypothetical protein
MPQDSRVCVVIARAGTTESLLVFAQLTDAGLMLARSNCLATSAGAALCQQ